MTTTTPDNNATTWRDLADELTPEQRQSYEDLERETHVRMPADVLLQYARLDIEGRLADMAYCDVSAPADVNWVGSWEKHIEFGWSRWLLWRDFPDVSVDGRQRCDGTVERGISLYLDDYPTLSSAEARQLAQVLAEAADELDGRADR